MTGGSKFGESLSGLLRALRELRAAWPQRGWSWDGRLQCVSSSFVTELEPKARAATAGVLPTEFTSATLSRAPTPYRELAERTGGLRSGQLLLVSVPMGHAFAYGLWWPWGDGMTTSLRVGLAGADSSHEALQGLRDAFGVEL
jgi:hypothetical protein